MSLRFFDRFVPAGNATPESVWASPAWMLLLVNAIPLLGVLLGGWTLLDVVVLYWLENLVIGGINILKMASCAPDEALWRGSAREPLNLEGQGAKSPRFSPAAHHASKFFLIPFFTVHYGMFCLIHGVFVFVLLGTGGVGGQDDPIAGMQETVREILGGTTLIAAVALLGSHLYSFVFHFLIGGEFRTRDAASQMFQPYGRIVVLHIAILFGAFAIMLLAQPLILLLLMIVGKTLLDWGFHAAEHAGGQARTLSEPSL